MTCSSDCSPGVQIFLTDVGSRLQPCLVLTRQRNHQRKKLKKKLRAWGLTWCKYVYFFFLRSCFFCFFKKHLFIYLAALGCSCSMQTLSWDVGSSSLTKVWIQGHCIGSVSLSHWTTWEVPLCMFLKYGSCLPQVVRFHQDRELASAPAAR